MKAVRYLRKERYVIACISGEAETEDSSVSASPLNLKFANSNSSPKGRAKKDQYLESERVPTERVLSESRFGAEARPDYGRTV